VDVQKLGPGDAYGQLSILTGIPSPGTFNALTAGLLLELRAEDLTPIMAARPELMEALSHHGAKTQQFLTQLERVALQPCRDRTA
jgi:CRP-like cAMP-binding protein